GRQSSLEDKAFMVYALTESGDSDARFVNELFSRRGELQPYGRALLALTLKIRRDESRARQLAGEIENSATANQYEAYWESKREQMLHFSEANAIDARAVSRKALSRIDPQSQMLPRVARWLVGNRRNGYYWDSTKQTAFAIYGLVDYVKASKELSPDYTVEVYLNGQQLATKRVT